MKVNDVIDWRAMYEAMKADRDRLMSLLKEREARTCYRVGSTLCCTCGARGEDTPSRLDDLEKRVSKLESAKGGET